MGEIKTPLKRQKRELVHLNDENEILTNFKTGINIEFIELEKIKVDGDNPNIMTTNTFQNLIKSLEHFKFMYPIITDSELLIADGEHRLIAAKEVGLHKVPVIRLPLKDVDRRLLRQVLNKISGEHDRILDIMDISRIKEEGQEHIIRQLIDTSDIDIERYMKAEDEKHLKRLKKKDIKKKHVKCPKCSYEFNPNNFLIEKVHHNTRTEPLTSIMDIGADHYLGKSNKVVLNLTFRTTQFPVSNSILVVAESFGIGIDETVEFQLFDNLEIGYNDTDIVFITGDSGSGKSQLLNRLMEHEIDRGKRVIRYKDIRISEDEVLIEGIGLDPYHNMRLLGMAGLSEPFLMIRKYCELSEGQRYRYQILKLFSSPSDVIVIDEFGSSLDRTTAKILGYKLQKWARKLGKMMMVASSHDDLSQDLNPDILITKEFGEDAQLSYFKPEPRPFSLIKECSIEVASYADYTKFQRFHYQGERPGFILHMYKMCYRGIAIGIIVYTSPFLSVSLRNAILPIYKKSGPKAVNRDIVRIARVIMLPKYRGVGLATKLVADTMRLTKARVVEVIAAMAEYNPFFEKAGMRYVGLLPFTREQTKVLTIIDQFGGDPGLLHNREERKKFINKLSSTEKRLLADALVRSLEAFMGQSGRGRNEAKRMIRELATQGLETLLKNMIPIKRAYLYWINPRRESLEHHNLTV